MQWISDKKKEKEKNKTSKQLFQIKILVNDSGTFDLVCKCD